MPIAALAPTVATLGEKLARPPPPRPWSAANATILPLARSIPSDAAPRLEKHRAARLGLEVAVQHQNGRIARCKFGADLLPMGCGFGVGEPGRNRQPRPYRALRVLETSRTDPAVLDRRVNIGRVRGRAGHTGETKCAVVGYHDGPSFLAELDESSIAQRWPRLIEGIELLEDQQSHRLTHIQRRLADRADQAAGVEFRNAGADFVEIGGAHHHRGLERARPTRDVHARVDVCR